MPVERAGYTVTIFLVDVSPSMGTLCTVESPTGPDGRKQIRQVTRLDWVLEFVLLKVQEMIFYGRKTDQCGVILFGTQHTDNVVNKENGDYEHIVEFLPVGQPSAHTMTKIKSIRPSTVIGDPIDAVIVGIETQAKYLAKKATWTRKMVLLTDGENPMEIEDWEATVSKMNDLAIQTSIIGVNFDDEYMPFYENNKPAIKRENEAFYKQFSDGLKHCVMGTVAFALQECSKPDIKMTKSALMSNVLRIGDVDTRPEEAVELRIKTSKCTAISRPPSMKKFAKRKNLPDIDADGDEFEDVYVLLDRKTQYFVPRDRDGQPVEAQSDDEDETRSVEGETVEKENLVRGYKYGASFVPVDSDEGLQRLEITKGIDICGFFPARNYRREWSIGEVQYIWADPNSARDQIAFSSIVQAMCEKGVMAITRWTGSGGDPKMGVMLPHMFENVDCFLWVQVPFADDLRKFTFRSLDRLVSKKGEVLTKHAYLPTDEQMRAMDTFVKAMDLMASGEKDEDGYRLPWFNTIQAYNPAVHRTKQALFHGAVASDLTQNPLPPPHPDLTMYFEPPPKVLKRARDAIEECKSTFKVKKAPPKKPTKRRKDGHVAGADEDEDIIDLGAHVPKKNPPVPPAASLSNGASWKLDKMDVDSETDGSDEDKFVPVKKPISSHTMGSPAASKPSTPVPHQPQEKDGVLPTPARSSSSSSPLPDIGRVPGRIIGSISPLEDFKQNIKEGDIVSQAVHDLGAVIKEIIMKPFASRRHQEMLACLKEMRQVALQEDEIASWNAFLRDLKEGCLNGTPNNQEFWAEIQKIGRPISLISSKEAKKLGGKSDVTEGTAVDFVEEED